jgi:hypothetical protein
VRLHIQPAEQQVSDRWNQVWKDGQLMAQGTRLVDNAPKATRDSFGWIQGALALGSLGAACAYAVLRSASILFYDGLGVTPEDVGLGQANLLVRSAGLLVIVLAFAAAVAVVVAYIVVIWAALRTWDLVLKELVDYLYKAPTWFQGTVIGVGMAAFIIGLVGLVIGLRGWTLLMFGPVVIYPIGGFVGRMIWGRTTGSPPVELRNAATQEWRRLGSLFRRVWHGTATCSRPSSSSWRWP